AQQRDLLTIAITAANHTQDGSTFDFDFAANSEDPMVAKEIHVTIYHILWELVHVFFEHPGVFGPGFAE
ncbi:MAG: phosphoheptose isomerase, partial [Bryobacteraceae bacterium]